MPARQSRLCSLVLAAGLGLGLFSPALAQNRTWTGSGSGSSWATNGNWSSSNQPDTPAETAVFGTSAKTAISVNLTNTMVGGMTFNAGASAYTFTIPNNRYLNLTGAGIVNNSSQAQRFVINDGGDLRFSTGATLGTNTYFNVSGERGVLYLQQNAKGGSANITVKDAGSLIITGNDEGWADAEAMTVAVQTNGFVLLDGTTTANHAAFTITDGGVYFQGTADPAQASFTLGDAGYLGFSQHESTVITLASLSGSGTVLLNGQIGQTLRTGNVSTTFSGRIGMSGYDGDFEKIGAGTLTLSGYSWDHYGNTTVAAGRLVVDGSIENSFTTVRAGATLAGSGTVGSLKISAGGIVAPGNSPGTLTAGQTFFRSGGILEFQIQDAGGEAGTGYDLLAINSSLELDGITGGPFIIRVVSLLPSDTAGLAANFDPAHNYEFTFLTTTDGIWGFSEDKFDLDLSGFANPFTGEWAVALVNDDHDLMLTYTGAGGAIPEPSTYAAIAGLGALGLVLARHVARKRATYTNDAEPNPRD